MLSKLWVKVAAIGGVLLGILLAALRLISIGREQEEAKVEKAANNQIRKSQEAMVKGLENEKKVAEEEIDTKNREGLQ